jgi:hypothetical protein
MRFYAPRRARRATARSTRPSHRLTLETLEDRLVPSLTDGAVLVATFPSTFAYGDQSGFPNGIVGVNPTTGAQAAVSTGNLFTLPTYTAEAPNQQLYITDLQAFGTGAIIAVDPNTGAQRLVTRGGFINGPNVLVFLNGYLYVANEGSADGTVHNIVQVDPNTGAQKLITDGSSGGFSIPVGMALAPGNNLYVADEPGNVQGSDPGKVWLVNLATGQQTIISSNNSTQGTLFNHPVDIALEASGNLVVVNTGTNGFGGTVIRVNAQTGVQSLVSSFSGLDRGGIDSIEVARDGTLEVGAISYSATPGRLYSVDPLTGNQLIIAQGGLLSEVEGIRAFHLTVSSSTTVVPSANPSVSGQAVTFTATVTGTGPNTPTGVVTFFDGSTSIGQGTLSTAGGSNTANFTTATLTRATHVITASYLGDANFNTSTSAPVTQNVNKASTTTAVSSSVNPSVIGQSLTLTATLSITGPGGTALGNPTGVVVFSDGAVSIGQGTLTTSAGLTTASFSSSSLTVGSHTITASYAGDNNFLGNSTTLTQTVNKGEGIVISWPARER